MKTKSIAAFIAAAAIITILSCNWFQSKKEKVETSNPLIGKWQLDSVKIGKDSSLAYAFLLMAMNEDSSGIQLVFAEDSLFTFSNTGTDTTLYNFEEKQKQLTIKDSIPYLYSFEKINDSLIALTSAKDSLVLYLKKE